jgi:hypothetical protein
MNADIHSVKKEPDYFAFQPQFGDIDLNGRKDKIIAP